jgi:hypothetical protein
MCVYRNCKVGRITDTDEHILANMRRVLEHVLVDVYGGWVNVRRVALYHNMFPELPLFETDCK